MSTETESTVTIVEVEGTALHRQYAGQHKPQPCYVSLSCDTGNLSASYDPEIGNGVPFSVYHGREQRWSIPALTEEAANGLLAEILPLAERVVAGYERVWNGSNHVGQFTEDAEQAMESIYDLCQRDWSDRTIEAWDAADWFGGVGNRAAQRRSLKITAETTDEALAAIIETEDDAAHPRIIEGLAKYITALRDDAVGEDEGGDD